VIGWVNGRVGDGWDDGWIRGVVSERFSPHTERDRKAEGRVLKDFRAIKTVTGRRKDRKQRVSQPGIRECRALGPTRRYGIQQS